MPRTNHSHVSFSSAASTSFRIKKLKRARVFFRSFSQSITTPPSASELIALLSYWPDVSINDQAREAIRHHSGSLTKEETEEVEAAMCCARRLQTSVIEACKLEHEAVWMQKVNFVVLDVLIQARDKGELSSTQDYLWTEGRGLRSNRESLHDPKPDFAFGLRPSPDSSQDDSFTESILDALQEASGVKLTYSPSQKDDIIYPAVVYEAKSDTNPIVWAENQVAVGVARSLGLLEELSQLSEVPYQHCVLAMASAGPQWKLYVAFQDDDEDKTVHLLPLLDRVLDIGNFTDRARLMFILSRVRRWMLGPYRDIVSEQVTQIWKALKTAL